MVCGIHSAITYSWQESNFPSARDRLRACGADSINDVPSNHWNCARVAAVNEFSVRPWAGTTVGNALLVTLLHWCDAHECFVDSAFCRGSLCAIDGAEVRQIPARA